MDKRKIKKSDSWDIKHINYLIDNGFNCKNMAKVFGCSSYGFGRMFKEKYGIYPSVYMAERKHIPRKKHETKISNAE